MILLFDIDGTLVSAGGAGRAALARAFEQVLGVANAMDGVRLAGSTDPAILDDAFGAHVGRPPTEAEAEQIFAAYLDNLRVGLVDAAFTIFEGAEDLVRAAIAQGYEVGLATGNLERGAHIKLERGKLRDYFEFGGFGSDAKDRGELVRCGVERGQARFAERHGRRAAREEIFVIGDTEKDVWAAHAADATAVGVLVGSHVPDQLVAADPEIVAGSLADPELWARFGLS
ncbi:MAG: haloacid dehalogenase-like hydrolase [Deltaproteobacteria bacterium]